MSYKNLSAKAFVHTIRNLTFQNNLSLQREKSIVGSMNRDNQCYNLEK